MVSLVRNTIADHERAATNLGLASKVTKFYSSAAEFASRVFEGSVVGAIGKEFVKPLKGFSEFTDVFSFMDPLNNLYAEGLTLFRNGQYLKLTSKVTLVAGLLFSPVIFATSTVPLFAAGRLGTVVATYGTMNVLGAAKNGLILGATSLTLADTGFANPVTEQSVNQAKYRWKAAKSLEELPLINHADRFQFRAARAGLNANQVANAYTNAHLAPAQVKYYKNEYDLRAAERKKAQFGLYDNIMKIAILSLTFVGAFFCGALVTSIGFAALGLAAAYIGWTKADLDEQINAMRNERVALNAQLNGQRLLG